MSDPVKMVQRKPFERTKIARTGKGLRDVLFDQLEKLANGDIDHQDARAFAGIAHALIKTVEVQLKYEQMIKRGEITSKASDALEIGSEEVAQVAVDKAQETQE